MAIPEQFIDELVARTDLVDLVSEYVHLSQKGGSYWGCCPFHNEKTPSFHVVPDRQLYKCFGCGKGGGAINFVMEMENLTYPDAIRHLAKRAGMEVPETGVDDEARKKYQRALAANKEAARFYHGCLRAPAGQTVRAYLDQRRITPRFATKFGLGAAPPEWDALIRALTSKGFSKLELIDAGLAVAGKNGSIYDKFRARLMLPVIDVRGDVVGFTSRILPGLEGAKYLNSPDTICFKKSRLLYGLNLAKNTRRPNLILVEGNLDVITLHQAGFDNVVATMGTALTADHARIIARYTKELVLCYDNDSAGRKSTDRVLGILKDAALTVRVLQLPNARDKEGKPIKQDPDDFIKNYGPAAFEKYLSGSTGQNDYRLDAIQKDADLSTDEGRMEYLKTAVETVGRMDSPIEREIYGNKAAAAANISKAAFAQEVERWRKGMDRQARRKETRQALSPVTMLQPKSRELSYRNPTSAVAEEGVIRLLLQDPDRFGSVELEPEQFSSPFLGKAFELLRRRHREGLSVQLAPLAGELSEQEMNQLIEITSRPVSLNNGDQAMKDYMEKIELAALERDKPKSMEALMELRQRKTMED